MRRIVLTTVILAAALSLAGCSAATSGSGASSSQADTGGAAPQKAPASDVALVDPTAEQRQVITTTDVVIRAANPISAADAAAHIAETAGGRVDDRTQTSATKTHSATANLTLRIPQEALPGALARLRALGSVTSLHQSADDVTTKSVDLAAKITALQTSITRLLSLEAKAKTTADLIALEEDIATRQGDLDSLTAQKRYLDDQVAMSTVNLTITAPPPVLAGAPANPGGALGAGLAGFAAFFTALFLVLTYLLPWLALAAAITFGTIFVVRWRRKRKAAVPTEP